MCVTAERNQSGFNTFSLNVAGAAAPASMSVLQIGFQGAKEPLDGQRLEVYPGINVSKSLCDTQESTLFIRAS